MCVCFALSQHCRSSPAGLAREARVLIGRTPATSAPVLGSPLPHLRRDWAHPCHICTGTGLAPATSAPRLGAPLPHLRRDWARPCHICAGTGLAAAAANRLAQEARVLHRMGEGPLRRALPGLCALSLTCILHRRNPAPRHICTWTRLSLPHSAPGPGASDRSGHRLFRVRHTLPARLGLFALRLWRRAP